MGLDSCKMIFDSTVRTEYFDQLCAQAKQNRIDGFCFSEPINFDGDIFVSNGFVAIYDEETSNRIALENYGKPFDYVVNAVKTLDNKDLQNIDIYSRISRNEIYLSFLQKVFYSLDASIDFSVLGNISYISKYANYPLANIEFNDFPEILDAILMRTYFSGKGLEVDCSLAPKGILFPSISILKRFGDLGGNILTLSSYSNVLGYGIREAQQILKNNGFKYHSVFKNMIPEMVKL